MIGYGFQTLQVCHVILSFYSPAVSDVFQNDTLNGRLWIQNIHNLRA